MTSFRMAGYPMGQQAFPGGEQPQFAYGQGQGWQQQGKHLVCRVFTPRFGEFSGGFLVGNLFVNRRRCPM